MTGQCTGTNVVKLVRLLQKDDQQLVYYDLGVGTTDNFPPVGLWNRIKESIRRIVRLAFADGVYDSIGRGYQFLVENFREGDRICVFGFSRGAFVARSIAGIVNEFGVQVGARALTALIVRTYFMSPGGRRPRATLAPGSDLQAILVQRRPQRWGIICRVRAL